MTNSPGPLRTNFIRPELRDKAIAVLQIWRTSRQFSEVLVTGGCMEPTIKKCSKVVVDHRINNIQAGDIVVFINQDHLTVHRVAHVKCDGEHSLFVTKGDNNDYCDSPIRDELILGKVVRIIQEPSTASLEEIP